jgi:hypothetical protein
MVVDVNTKTTCQIDIEPEEAFRILCKTLNMEFVLDEDTVFYIVDTLDGEWRVDKLNKDEMRVEHMDDRGKLFVALRNVAVNIFPNLGFRKEPYINGRW